jgi:hypothetical protein
MSNRIPLEAVRVYARARQLSAEGLGPHGSPKYEEFVECRNAIRRLCNRPPWTAHPFDVTAADVDAPPPFNNPDYDAAGALTIRQQLDAALA